MKWLKIILISIAAILVLAFIAFQVIKQSDANTLEVVRQVEKQVKQLRQKLPEIQLTLAETPAGYIRQATKATIEALLGAVALAILVIFPFLRNFKATLITAIAIPISLLGTFIANILFYKLVQITNPLFSSMVSYLIPIVAIGWGLVDGELITVFHFIGFFLILFGVYLSKTKKEK